MKALSLFAATVLTILSATAYASGTTYTRCNVFDGKATGYFCISNGSTTKSGTATIHVYKPNGQEIITQSTTTVASVLNRCQEIISVHVSREAMYCSATFQ